MISKIQALKKHQGFKKYLFNTNWLFLEKVFRLGVSFFVGIYIARYLGPEQFGMLNYSLSFVYLFGAIAGLGLRSVLIRELVKGDTQKANKLLGTGFVLQAVGAIALVLIANT
ncbi:MAG: oligosaccharide flippase family protein, partial [Campylobacterales bacterium]